MNFLGDNDSMKITISKEFATAEEAIEFLQTQTLGIQIPRVVGGEAEVVAEQTGVAAQSTVVEAFKKARKPRSDAGQPRGPYKPRETTATAQAETPAPESAAPAAVAPAAKPASNALTVDDVKAAMTRLMKKEGVEGNLALLRQFGVEKVSLLPATKYAEFIAAANAKMEAK